MDASACVFCKIVSKQDGSSRIIYEDDRVVAFQVCDNNAFFDSIPTNSAISSYHQLARGEWMLACFVMFDWICCRFAHESQGHQASCNSPLFGGPPFACQGCYTGTKILTIFLKVFFTGFSLFSSLTLL